MIESGRSIAQYGIDQVIISCMMNGENQYIGIILQVALFHNFLNEIFILLNVPCEKISKLKIITKRVVKFISIAILHHLRDTVFLPIRITSTELFSKFSLYELLMINRTRDFATRN